MESVTARGIPNVSGVACHLSSALQLLLHSIPALRTALLELNQKQYQVEWLQKLSHLTHALFEEHEVAIDPLSLYTSLSETTSLDPHSLGDAVSALRVLLRMLQQYQGLQPILQHSLMKGRVEQTLTATCITGNGKKIQRQKTKEKLMSCPFSVPVRDETCLQQALQKVTIQPQPIHGLDWNQVSGYTEEEIDNGDDCTSDDDDWSTTQTNRFVSLPQHLILHLQRFRYENDSVNISTNQVDIPKVLDMTPFMTNKTSGDDSSCHDCQLYQFAGAIMFVSDDDSSSLDEEEEGGHYVTLIQLTGNHTWYLLNDEKVTPLPDNQQVLDDHQVLNFVSGRPTDIQGIEEGTYSAVVVVYSRICEACTDKRVTCRLLEDLKEALRQEPAVVPSNTTTITNETTATKTTIDWSKPLDLIGKRLQVRWKSGRYYSGVVSSFDEDSGKHCVTYDDGDVRHYTLRKKTIKWID